MRSAFIGARHGMESRHAQEVRERVLDGMKFRRYAHSSMRRALKILGFVVGALVVVIGGFLLYVQIDGIPHYAVEKVTFRADPTPERIERGRSSRTALRGPATWTRARVS
jgi:hypothetical protein